MEEDFRQVSDGDLPNLLSQLKVGCSLDPTTSTNEVDHTQGNQNRRHFSGSQNRERFHASEATVSCSSPSEGMDIQNSLETESFPKLSGQPQLSIFALDDLSRALASPEIQQILMANPTQQNLSLMEMLAKKNEASGPVHFWVTEFEPIDSLLEDILPAGNESEWAEIQPHFLPTPPLSPTFEAFPPSPPLCLESEHFQLPELLATGSDIEQITDILASNDATEEKIDDPQQEPDSMMVEQNTDNSKPPELEQERTVDETIDDKKQHGIEPERVVECDSAEFASTLELSMGDNTIVDQLLDQAPRAQETQNAQPTDQGYKFYEHEILNLMRYLVGLQLRPQWWDKPDHGEVLIPTLQALQRASLQAFESYSDEMQKAKPLLTSVNQMKADASNPIAAPPDDNLQSSDITFLTKWLEQLEMIRLNPPTFPDISSMVNFMEVLRSFYYTLVQTLELIYGKKVKEVLLEDIERLVQTIDPSKHQSSSDKCGVDTHTLLLPKKEEMEVVKPHGDNDVAGENNDTPMQEADTNPPSEKEKLELVGSINENSPPGDKIVVAAVKDWMKRLCIWKQEGEMETPETRYQNNFYKVNGQMLKTFVLTLTASSDLVFETKEVDKERYQEFRNKLLQEVGGDLKLRTPAERELNTYDKDDDVNNWLKQYHQMVKSLPSLSQDPLLVQERSHLVAVLVELIHETGKTFMDENRYKRFYTFSQPQIKRIRDEHIRQKTERTKYSNVDKPQALPHTPLPPHAIPNVIEAYSNDKPTLPQENLPSTPHPPQSNNVQASTSSHLSTPPSHQSKRPRLRLEELTEATKASIEPGRMVMSDVINFYFGHICEAHEKDGKLVGWHFCNTFWFQKLWTLSKSNNPNKRAYMERLRKGVDPPLTRWHDVKYLVVPIHLDNNDEHWSLITVEVKSSVSGLDLTIMHMDSLRGQHPFSQICDVMEEWIKLTCESIKFTSKRKEMKVPSQINSVDCGVHVMQNIKSLVDIQQENITINSQSLEKLFRIEEISKLRSHLSGLFNNRADTSSRDDTTKASLHAATYQQTDSKYMPSQAPPPQQHVKRVQPLALPPQKYLSSKPLPPPSHPPGSTHPPQPQAYKAPLGSTHPPQPQADKAPPGSSPPPQPQPYNSNARETRQIPEEDLLNPGPTPRGYRIETKGDRSEALTRYVVKAPGWYVRGYAIPAKLSPQTLLNLEEYLAWVLGELQRLLLEALISCMGPYKFLSLKDSTRDKFHFFLTLYYRFAAGQVDHCTLTCDRTKPAATCCYLFKFKDILAESDPLVKHDKTMTSYLRDIVETISTYEPAIKVLRLPDPLAKVFNDFVASHGRVFMRGKLHPLAHQLGMNVDRVKYNFNRRAFKTREKYEAENAASKSPVRSPAPINPDPNSPVPIAVPAPKSPVADPIAAAAAKEKGKAVDPGRLGVTDYARYVLSKWLDEHSQYPFTLSKERAKLAEAAQVDVDTVSIFLKCYRESDPKYDRHFNSGLHALMNVSNSGSGLGARYAIVGDILKSDKQLPAIEPTTSTVPKRTREEDDVELAPVSKKDRAKTQVRKILGRALHKGTIEEDEANAVLLSMHSETLRDSQLSPSAFGPVDSTDPLIAGFSLDPARLRTLPDIQHPSIDHPARQKLMLRNRWSGPAKCIRDPFDLQARAVDLLVRCSSRSVADACARTIEKLAHAYEEFAYGKKVHCRETCEEGSDPVPCCYEQRFGPFDHIQGPKPRLNASILSFDAEITHMGCKNHNSKDTFKLPLFACIPIEQWLFGQISTNPSKISPTQELYNVLEQCYGAPKKQVDELMEEWVSQVWQGSLFKRKYIRKPNLPLSRTSIVKEWFEDNLEYPYLTMDTCQELCAASLLTWPQVAQSLEKCRYRNKYRIKNTYTSADGKVRHTYRPLTSAANDKTKADEAANDKTKADEAQEGGGEIQITKVEESDDENLDAVCDNDEDDDADMDASISS